MAARHARQPALSYVAGEVFAVDGGFQGARYTGRLQAGWADMIDATASKEDPLWPTRARRPDQGRLPHGLRPARRSTRRTGALDLTQSFDLVFERGLEQGVIDRPIEIVYREVEGLPKGSAKAVIDAYGELVDEGCLAVFGPFITDNCEPTRVAIERRFEVPAISVTGSEAWLGPWTFSLPMGR